MANEQGDLFDESSRGKIGASKVVWFVLASILAFGGMVTMSYGFNTALSETVQFWVFVAGLGITLAGFAIPFGLPYATSVKSNK